MKLRIKKEELKSGISIAERIASRSISLPILKNISIRAEKDLINISATDLEIGVEWWGSAKTDKTGELVVPSSILSGFINLLPDAEIELTSNKEDLNINCSNYNTQIKGFNPEEFPIIPEVAEKESVLVDIQYLCKSLSCVVDIPTFSTTRPEISGILFKFDKNILKIVATDSYRLGEKTIKLNSSVKNPFFFILPQKSAKEIISIFGETEGDIKIVFGANQVLFELLMTNIKHPKIRLISRQIEGDYPNYEEIIPKKNQITAILERSDLLNQIKAAGLFSGKSGEVIFKIEPTKNKIEIVSQNSEAGEYNSTLLGKITGKKETISFNYRYLVDGILSIKTPEVLFEINSSSEPGVLKPTKGIDFLYIIMPIKA